MFEAACALGVGRVAIESGAPDMSLLQARIDAAERGETLPEEYARITPAAATGVLSGV